MDLKSIVFELISLDNYKFLTNEKISVFDFDI